MHTAYMIVSTPAECGADDEIRKRVADLLGEDYTVVDATQVVGLNVDDLEGV